MAESAVSAVLGRIGDLVVKESSLLCAVTGEVEFLKHELARLQGFLKDANNKMRSGNSSIAVCVWQVRDASYEAENIIEAAEYLKRRNMLKKGFMGAISRYAHLPSDLVALHKIDSQISCVRRKLAEIKDSMSRFNITSLSNESEDINDDVHIPENFEDNAVVGFDDEYKEIVKRLVYQESKKLTVVSLVAMGGAGKTTLARKVYNSPQVKQHFEKVAWVTVSQKFKGIDLLEDILKQITRGTDELRATDQILENEVGKKIHDFLLQKRYLVVLDDVWETDTWDQINRTAKVFPDTNNGSKVLLTTRKKDAAHHVQMPTYVHNLKLMSEEKSWELFCSKALPSYKRSMICNLGEFEELGKKLATKCHGLPLDLTVLGGYLSKNLNIEAWSDLLLDWTSTKDGQMMGVILARSYNDMSSMWLKSCFLYLASFPEDHLIPVTDLIELWIAECFIPHKPRHTLEETARRYLTELAQRNLVQEGEEITIGHIKCATIRIHDILRDWCIEEARRDCFLGIIDQTAGQVGASSSDTMAFYRFCFQNFYHDRILQATPNLRTLIAFGLSALHYPQLRFLKVLHVENSTIKNAMLIRGCIHLRYLRLRNCKVLALPSSVGKLLYLQTVDLRLTFLSSVLPITVWAIPTIRHIYLDHGSCSSGAITRDPMPILEKLPCLVVLHLQNYEGPTMSFSAQGFPQLQELALGRFFTEWTIEIGAMPRLRYMYLRLCRMSKLPEGLLHLPSFKKLVLTHCGDLSYDNTWKELEIKGCKVESRDDIVW